MDVSIEQDPEEKRTREKEDQRLRRDVTTVKPAVQREVHPANR